MVYLWLHETDFAEKWVSPTFLIVFFKQRVGGLRQYGTLPRGVDCGAIIARATPKA